VVVRRVKQLEQLCDEIKYQEERTGRESQESQAALENELKQRTKRFTRLLF